MARSIIILAFQTVILTVFIPLLSCAIVTVNVYFPAEEVREAYKSLEEELLGPPPQGSPESESPSKEKPQGQPQSLRSYPEKPQVGSRRFIFLRRKFSLDIGTLAHAQGNLSNQIAREIRSMPEVMKAFRSRKGRLGITNNLLSQGKVGEGDKGLLVRRGNLTGGEVADVNAENSDRQTIIKGMARAIVKINNLDPDPENVDRILPQAAEQFAAVQREDAEPGWEIQLPDGKWVKK